MRHLRLEKPYFTVNGQVQRPGKYELRDTTLCNSALMKGLGLLRYFGAAAALRAASINSLTRGVYRKLTRLKRGPRPISHDPHWLLDSFPKGPSRILDLGTGWVHAYSLYPALLRNDEIHCFDVADNRGFSSLIHTVRVVLKQIDSWQLDPASRDQAEGRALAVAHAVNFEEVYRYLGMKYQCSPTGIPDYPDGHFDIVFSIDVLEHVDARVFRAAADTWYRILKPGGRFLAQVGIDDHLSHYNGMRDMKRYLRYSHRTWDRLLQNEVQYINRLTASQIVNIVKDAGFRIDDVKTEARDISRSEVHSDYQWQSTDDIQAIRLLLRASKRPS
jgi:SAM-dependent methyltransferase